MADFKPFELTREQKTGMSLNDIAEAEKSLLAANVEITRQRIKDRADFVAQTPVTNATFKEAVTEAAKYKPGETREFIMDFADKTPLPEETLARIAHNVSQAKFDSLQEHEKNKLFSDAELEDSFLNNVANEALNVTGRAIDVTTNLATTGQFLAQTFRRAGISDEDAKAYDSIQKSKAEAQDALYSLNGLYGTPKETDPLKRAVLEDRVAKNNPQLYTKEQKEFLASGKESIINDIQQNDRARRSLTDFTGGVSDIVNKNAMERLVQDAKTGFKNSEGIIETVASAAEALADNPYGIFQAVMQTAPDIALAGASFGASVASNVIEKNYEAEEIYKGKHGKDALGADRDTLALSATVGGIIDAASDKFIAGGAGKVTDVAKKAGLTTSFKLLDGTAGMAAKAVQRPVTGGLAEYGAESVGAGLTQYAGLQDVNEVDIAQAHAEGVVGFGAGASISAVTGTFKAIGSSMGTVVERAKKRQDAVETADIKTLLSPEGGMDIKGATQVMHKIVTDLNVSDDKKAQAIYDIEKVIDDKPVIEIILNKLRLEQEDDPTEARAKRIAGGEAKLADIAAVEEKVKFMKDTFKGNSIEAAYKALTEDSAPESDEDTEPSRQAAAKRVDEEVNTPYSKFTVEMAQEVLDKRIEILTEDQIANLQSYINTNSAMDNLTEKMSTAQVNTHVVIGGGNDVGARTYVNGIISAIKHKNPDLAKDTLSQLVSFAETHAHKAAEYGKIVASFDAGTPMSAEEQLAIMQPFESKKKGNKAKAIAPRIGTHGKYLVPKFMRLMADEAAMLKLVSDEMTTRVNRYENSLKAAAEPVADVPAGNAPQSGAVAQPEITLDQLLDMKPDDAIKFLNPSNNNNSEKTNTNNEFLSDDMSEVYSQDVADAEVIKTINKDTKPVRLVMPEEQVIHAVKADGKVIGSISLQDGETTVQMHEESSQQGIGPQIIAEFIRRYPNAKAGSFTSNGLKAYKKALDILKKEREANRAQDTVDAEQPTVSQPVKPEPVQTKDTASIVVRESSASDYRERTGFNVNSAGVTVAIAVDFNSAGERLTRNLASKQGKYFKIPFGESAEKVGKALAAFMVKKGTHSLNVAGNGIYTFGKNIEQNQVNQYVLEVIAAAHKINPITKIVSGGQTGVDIAGAVAAKVLGIPAVITLPKGFRQRDKTGEETKSTKAGILKQIEEGAKGINPFTEQSAVSDKSDDNQPKTNKEMLDGINSQNEVSELTKALDSEKAPELSAAIANAFSDPDYAEKWFRESYDSVGDTTGTVNAESSRQGEVGILEYAKRLQQDIKNPLLTAMIKRLVKLEKHGYTGNVTVRKSNEDSRELLGSVEVSITGHVDLTIYTDSSFSTRLHEIMHGVLRGMFEQSREGFVFTDSAARDFDRDSKAVYEYTKAYILNSRDPVAQALYRYTRLTNVLANREEFFVWATTHSGVARALAAIPYKSTSVFTIIMQTLAKALGFTYPSDSVMGEISRLLVTALHPTESGIISTPAEQKSYPKSVQEIDAELLLIREKERESGMTKEAKFQAAYEEASLFVDVYGKDYQRHILKSAQDLSLKNNFTHQQLISVLKAVHMERRQNTYSRDIESAVPEADTLERETEVETRRVSDKVLNESVSDELPAVDVETKSNVDNDSLLFAQERLAAAHNILESLKTKIHQLVTDVFDNDDSYFDSRQLLKSRDGDTSIVKSIIRGEKGELLAYFENEYDGAIEKLESKFKQEMSDLRKEYIDAKETVKYRQSRVYEVESELGNQTVDTPIEAKPVTPVKELFDVKVEELVSEVESVIEELESLVQPHKIHFPKVNEQNAVLKSAITQLSTRGAIDPDVLKALAEIVSVPLMNAIKAIAADVTKLNVADNIRGILQQSREQADKVNTTAISQLDPSTLPSFLQNLQTGVSAIGKTGNAVLDYFGFRTEKGMSNPLVSIKGFMNQLAEGVTFDSIKDLLPTKYKELTANNKTLLKEFADFNKQFHAAFVNTYVPKEFKFAHKDFAAYFVDQDGNFKPEVIDTMSLAAFNWFITKSNDSLDTDEKKIGAILGLKDTKGATFSDYTWATVSNLGVPYTQEVQTLGDSIQKSLGLFALPDAPWTVEGRLSDALGNAAVQTMLGLKDAAGVPYVKVVTLSAKDREAMHLVDIEGSHEAAAAIAKTQNDIETKNTKGWFTGNRSLRTLQVSYTETANGFRSPIETIQGKILEPAKSQGSFLQDLFGAITPDTLPTFEPVDVRKQSQVMKRTDRKLSQFSKSVHQKFNNVKTFLKPEMVNVLGKFNRIELADMFGAVLNVEAVRHVDNVKSQMSKNNLIMRGVDSLMDFIEGFHDLTGELGFSTPWYLSHETNRVGRDQLTQKVMNMQTDKIARHAAYRDGWQVTIAMNDVGLLENLYRAVGQAMGVSLDKNKNEKSTRDSLEKINDPVIAKAIQAAVGILNNEDGVDTQAIYDAVKYIGTAAAGLDGIMTYAKYEQAKQVGASEFEVTIGVERDGVTNGPIFTLLQFGEVGKDWADMLSAGGWFIDSPYENVADAKEKGVKDLYEKVAAAVNAAFKTKDVFEISRNETVALTPEMRQAFITLFGSKNKLTDEIEIANRNAAKPMLTVKNYQSSDHAASVKAGIATIELIKSSIERVVEFAETDPVKHAANLSEVDAIINAINTLAGSRYVLANIDEPLKTIVLTTKLINVPVFNHKLGNSYNKQMTLSDFISKTYGNMFVEAVNKQNSLIQQMTADTVKVSNMAVMAYDAVRSKLIKEAQAEKLKNAPTKVALFNELTKAEMRAIENQLADAFPEVYTALSKVQGEGTSLVSYEAEPNITPYKVETGFKGADGKNHNSEIEGESTRVSSPGVNGVVSKVLALDGATLTKAKDKHPSMLGLFDATMNGLTTDLEAAKQLNRDMFDVTMNHSIPLEVASMSERVLAKAIELMGEDFEFDADTIKRFKIDEEVSLRYAMKRAEFLKALAEKQLAERQKYLRERKMQLNHYFAEGAAVTFINGEEVIAEEKTPTQLTNDFKDAMSNVVQETMRPKADPVNSDKPSSPTLDLPSTSSEELNELFDVNGGVLSVAKAMTAFSEGKGKTVNAVKAIVNALIKQLDSNTKVVRYSHSVQYTGDLAWLHSHPMMVNNADDTRGMYFPADPKAGINTPTIVLMADDMKNSGVNSETLFHELIHALFDKKVFSNRGTPTYTELFKIMDTVRSSLTGLYNNDADIKDFINSLGGINNFAPMENAKEFLAWGLSSVPFQKILSKVNHVVTEELSNQFTVKPKSAMAALRGLIQKVLFNRPKGSKPNESIDNALAGLIDVALLLQENGLSQDTKPSRQQGARHELLNVTKLNSREVFQKLANIGGNIASAAQQAHLSNMLDTVVNSVLQPLKVNLITAAIAENDSDLSATDKLNVLLANNYGVQLTNPPVQYGFNKSAQESYVHGLYLNILEHGLKVGSPHVNAANALFNEAKALLTYKDFMTDPSIVDPVAIAAAQARYDSVFNVRTSKVKTITDVSSGMQHQLEHSDYLRNFLALAATNEQFRKALNQVVPTAQTNTPTLFKRVVKFVLGIVDWVGNRVTGVNPNKTIQANLDMLTTRLVGAEYQAQSNVEGALNRTIDFTGKAVGTAVNVFKSGLATVGKLPILNRPTSWKIAQLAGVTLRIVGNNQTQFAYDAMGQYMERLSQGKQGMIGELGTELKGTTKDNTKIHTLMRIANHVLDRGRKGVIDTMAKMLRSTFKTELTKEEKTALTKHLLRTDISALVSRGYDLNQLADLIDRTTYRTQEIAAIEAQIGHVVTTELATFYTNKAHELGASMVEGPAKGILHIPNAYGIARLWGTRKAVPDDLTIAHVEPLIDALATLRALERAAMVSSKRAGIAAEVIRREANHDPMANGITFLLEQHRLLKEKSLRDNFGGKPALMRKGYMPDITNPYIDAVPALTSAKEEMAAKGYKEMYQLPNDANNPNQESLSLYVGDGAGLATMMRGAMANKGKRAKGNPMQDYGDVAMITALNQQHIPDMFKTRKEPAFGNGSIHMSEVFNERGEIVSYRYIMAESTKDDLLERNDDFSEVMGSLAGKIYDKTVTTPHNELVIKTLREQYEIDMKSGKYYNYITVSGSSTDPEIRDMYNLLPYEAKQEIKKHFGTDSLPIRAEALRVIFGYRKMTIANLWENGGVDNNVLQQLVKVTLDAMTGGQGMRRASQAERALMELTRIAKQTIVVRTGSVLLMNMLSNTYTLLVSGMNLKNATIDQAIGIRKGIEYVKQSSRIAEIDLLLEADHTPSHRNALLSEKAQLKQLQSINPVAELIEAGLLQTIVMDISQDIDPYSAGTKLANKMEEYIDKMPTALADASKFMLMTKGSESFEFMNKMTQFSDFGARYALFKHLTTRQDNPMDKSSAMQSVINKFINYDLPTHRALQYGNDIGLIWFSKYFLRVQKVIIESFAENPGRVLLGLMMQGMIGVDAPDITDSGFLETGIFHPVRGFDNIASGLLTTPATIPL